MNKIFLLFVIFCYHVLDSGNASLLGLHGVVNNNNLNKKVENMAFNNSVDAKVAGFQSITSAGVWNGRTLVQGSGITITNADGTAGDPTISASGASFSPNSTVTIFDDFIGANIGTLFINSLLSWETGTANSTAYTPVSGHPGLITHPINVTNQYLALSNIAGFYNSFVLGGGSITCNWVINIAALSDGTNTYTLRIGMGDTNNADHVNGVYFEYSSGINSGNWVLKTASASTRTTTNTATAVTSGWHNLQITVNAGATSVNYTLDGVSLGDITTNIPSASIAPIWSFVRSAGSIAAGTIVTDLFYLSETLTTPR